MRRGAPWEVQGDKHTWQREPPVQRLQSGNELKVFWRQEEATVAGVEVDVR